jgi:hypothetical protein
MQFNFKYFRYFVVLLAAEVFIGTKVHDSFIRPFVGDFLVVILIYCFVRSFFKVYGMPTVLSILFLSYAVELSQAFHLVNVLGLQDYKMARLILGTTFSWTDLLMYTLGIILVVVLEILFGKKPQYSHS